MLKDIIVFFVGILVGGMNSIAGGGMLVGFPILLGLGWPALIANATSSLIIWPGQLSSAYGYRKYIRKVPKQYLWLIIPCAIGGAIGATSLRHVSSAHFEKIVPLLILFAVILFAVQPILHHQIKRHLHGKSKSNLPLLFIGIALLPMATYGGFFGAGFGFIMLALLGFSSLHDLHMINGLKNISALIIAGASVICLYSSGLIDWHLALVMGAGTFIGGFAGSHAAQKVSSHTMRIIVIFIGLVSAAYLGLRQY